MNKIEPEPTTLTDTIQGYFVAKADLENFIDSLSDFSDQKELDKLRRLESQLEAAFEQILNHDKGDLTASLDKLKFLIDEIKGSGDFSDRYKGAISAALADMTKFAEVHAGLPANDRRQHARTSVNKMATFISENSKRCACTVENISFQGLCLTVEDEGLLTDTFRLQGVFEGGVVEAREVWRNGRTVGARIMACLPA